MNLLIQLIKYYFVFLIVLGGLTMYSRYNKSNGALSFSENFKQVAALDSLYYEAFGLTLVASVLLGIFKAYKTYKGQK